jgi:hypothetical protein
MDPQGDLLYLDCHEDSQDHQKGSLPQRLERLEILLFYLNLVTWLKGMHISG